jgi:hypothetical protein
MIDLPTRIVVMEASEEKCRHNRIQKNARETSVIGQKLDV